ncbi:unnamed protein product [Adineta steineri]|uniref:Uncharacterized protein n=1 Tax=Adineta steineri TaxID=433720 RepID=A0A815FZG9_9BILA|nr:unnamed protein product [Adineta steineri]CAF1433584.1 unnamed protein product [Adineta steineri]CAF1589752.1 unnamed protein product [Adineta steineri]CAF1625231.1 unnamed protein product [Adineta steineri]
MTTIQDENESNNSSTVEELTQLNKLFAKRYTNEDKEYIQMSEPCSTGPPIVDDWGEDRKNYQNQRNRYTNNNCYNRNNQYDRQQHRNYSHDRRDRSRSPTSYYDKRR